MSENDNTGSSDSGMPPVVRTPTIIGSGTSPEVPLKKGPTIIGTRVTPPPEELLAKPTPTIIPSTPQVAAPLTTVRSPSLMPGTQYIPVVVEVAELKKEFPGASEDILTRVKTLLGGIVVTALTSAQCSTWGATVQREYSDLVDRGLALTQRRTVSDGVRHLGRLFTLLSEVSTSLIGTESHSVLKLWTKTEAPHEVLKDNEPEINQLRNLLGKLLPQLEQEVSEQRSFTIESENLIERVLVESLAGNHVSNLIPDHEQSNAQILLSRSMSLMKTVGFIKEGIALRNAAIVSTEGLTEKIRDTVLGTLPMWMEKVSLLSHGQHTETELYELSQSAEAILQKLR